ncbi:MAG: hypothetical protein LBF00_02160 [Mycoplasmataceae bacterium]|nr:hypothetical protein [Mycoplasmataceae bacterium]
MNGKSNVEYWASDSSLTFDSFIGAFNSCLLAFAGFEVFSTAGKNIENPSKNISKGY